MGGFLLSSTTNAIGIHPAAGCSTGRDIPQEAEEHQQETAGCSCSTGRNMSGGDSRMLHRRGYTARGSGTNINNLDYTKLYTILIQKDKTRQTEKRLI